MRKRIFGVLSFVGAALWPLLWEFVRSLFYERGSHMLAPFIDSITIDQIIHWGPTVGLSFLGLWLFWKTRPEKTTNTGGGLENFLRDQSSIGNPTRNIIESPPIPNETTASRDYHWQFDSQMALETGARLRSRPEWQDKIIVDVTPEYLWGLFRGRTSMQGGKLAEPFLNKWMVVCGPFRDVRELEKQLCVNFAFRATIEIVFMYFNESWRDRLEIITQAKKIAVVGRIDRINNDTLQLEDCELVQ